ncbi:MAG: hypothetical protein Q8Q60_01400 [Candidatus Chromulinivorax sp.]|nr:hypothetical protein [Candidatus Chromulinivorax sp.]
MKLTSQFFKIFLCSLLILPTRLIQASLNQGVDQAEREGHNANLRNGLTIVADDPKMTIYHGEYQGQKVVIEEFVINSKCRHGLRSGITKNLVYQVNLEHDEWFHRMQSSNLQEIPLLFKFHKTDVTLLDIEYDRIVSNVLSYFNLHRRAHEFAFKPSA